MINTNRLMLALPLLLSLSACIAFPTRSGDPEPFGRKEIAFIEVGKTTKNEIIAEMSWPMRSPDGDMWLYAKSRREDESYIGFGGGGRRIGTIDYRYLLVRFDENGVVAALETSGSEEFIGCSTLDVCGLGSVLACHPTGACASGVYYTATASEELDRAVRQFDIPEEGCVAYVYGETGTMTHLALDGLVVGGLLGDQGFFTKKLDKGVRQLAVSGPEVRADKIVEFTCRSRGLVFLEIQTTRPGLFVGHFWVEVSQRDASEGRQAIDERELMLLVN